MMPPLAFTPEGLVKMPPTQRPDRIRQRTNPARSEPKMWSQAEGC